MAEGDQSRSRPATVAPTPSSAGPAPQPFRLEGLLLLDSAGNHPITVDAVTFADDGIGVIRKHGEQARVLPWPPVSTHVVETWGGGVIPEWWVDPELNRNEGGPPSPGTVTDPSATGRALPHTGPGALISIQTPHGTYRFLLPGGDPDELLGKITAFAVRHQGPMGASTVTTVVAAVSSVRRRRLPPRPPGTSSWSKIQPYLVVVLVVIIATAVTLILLQSAGTIHLPFLGGANPGSVGPVRAE